MPDFMVQIAPAFAAFEIAQLFVAQRYIGIKQIRSNVHPLEMATPPRVLGTVWLAAMLADYVYQAGLLFEPQLGIKFAALLLVMVSAGGFAVRRICGLRWGLVVLTLECASRAGFFMFIFNMMVIHRMDHMYGLEWLYNSR